MIGNARILLIVIILASLVLTACTSSEKNYDYVPVEGGSCEVKPMSSGYEVNAAVPASNSGCAHERIQL